MKKKRRNALYSLIAQVVSENPKLASGSLKRVVRRRPQPPYCPSCGILNYHCNCDNFQVRHDND